MLKKALMLWADDSGRIDLVSFVQRFFVLLDIRADKKAMKINLEKRKLEVRLTVTIAKLVEAQRMRGDSVFFLSMEIGSKKPEINLDRTYSRMLRLVLNLNWKTHPTIGRLYGQLPRTSSVIRERRTEQCLRRKFEVISDVMLWDPKH